MASGLYFWWVCAVFAGDGGTGAAPSLQETAKQTAALALVESAKVTFDRLRQEIPKLYAQMRSRAVERRVQGRVRVEWVLSLLPALALLFVPLWLWRRGTFRQAREKGRARGRVIFSATVATIAVTALLGVFVQLFLLLESVKSRLAIAPPSQLIAVKALEHSLETGKALIASAVAGSRAPAAGAELRPSMRAIAPAVEAVVSGSQPPETFLQSVIRNAAEVWKSGALQYGYQVVRFGKPVFDHLWSILIVFALLLFLRFAKPAIAEIADHVGGSGKPGTTLLGTAVRNVVREGLVVLVFLVPYAIVTTLVTFVAYWVTDFGAGGIVDNLFTMIDRLVAEDVPTYLIILSFSALMLFLFEILLLLIAVTAVLLGSWMHYLHARSEGGRLRQLPRFLLHFLLTTVQLVPALVLVPAVLYVALGWARAAVGTTIEMLLPVFVLVSFNLLLWAGRFFKGLRGGLRTDRWRPAGAAEPASIHPELP
jgi:hypothetical protein